MPKRLPVTIVTGFLGSGKTTLLRHLLSHGNRRLAIIVNEFGSVGLDGDLFKSCGFCPDDEIDDRLFELNNGCLCCTVQEDFLPTMEKLLIRSSSIDGIVIETSGLALPKPLVKALSWPSIKSKVYVNGVVTLVDGEALSKGSLVGNIKVLEEQRLKDENIDHITPLEELFSDQLEISDLVLISRADLVNLTMMSQLKKKIHSKVKDSTPIIPINNGTIEPSIVLGLDRDYVEEPLTDSIQHEPHEPHEHHEHHEHLQVFSTSVSAECELIESELKEVLTSLVVKYQIIRLKGRFWLENKSFPLQVQMVGQRFDSWFEKPLKSSWIPEKSGLEIVVLSFKECFVSEILESFERRSVSQ